MDISKMSKTELEQQLYTQFKDVGKENKNEVLKRLTELKETEGHEEIELMRSLNDKLGSIDETLRALNKKIK